MPVPVLFPKVSLEETTGRVSRWLVPAGEAVTAGQVLFEIENDKAAVEVESPAAGILRDLVAEGDTVDVGAPVANIYQEGEAAGEAPQPAPAAGPSGAQAPEAAREEEHAPPRGRLKGPNPTPLARRIARENGISLAGMQGSGPNGRVQKKDVLESLTSQPSEAPSAPVAHRPAVSSAGGPLHSVWLRKGEGTPVVLLHGYSADLNNWRGLFAGASTPWPVLALDLPAHGGSPRAVPEDLDALAGEVEASLEALGVTSCHLVGHSFGAATAVRLASRAQIDIRALGLISPAGLGPEINHAFTAGILRASSAASLRPWLELLVEDPRVISEAFLRAVEASRTDEALTAAMGAFAARFFADGTQTFSIREELARLRMPARVIFGRQDRILPFASSRGLPGNVGLHAFDGCGHMPHLEHPGPVLALLSELIRSAA
ncbi:acetoin dehydrogenase dihydrolipoyllysine-residue acetyltransferase subunit [Paracoccus sp. S-4012]|uniref:acetoin dehydrogenase dihydrolipoyllysine-residue acetyltransferase subunit n=1 Tax=Paracoccus sp. S-4012 TaxID=2665648 RepID=UPI0012B0BBEF|nr:acetoin dehydrogenase dihydrolipoyllysine-residue acetyltransferase subunit [Paracoccus sp. S-4012]MRX51808.1 acetoin dehydrogenase dihydrolipoyllysine-residue acetyltransferase subunit [Paracoccus sp. S-4012]